MSSSPNDNRNSEDTFPVVFLTENFKPVTHPRDDDEERTVSLHPPEFRRIERLHHESNSFCNTSDRHGRLGSEDRRIIERNTRQGISIPLGIASEIQRNARVNQDWYRRLNTFGERNPRARDVNSDMGANGPYVRLNHGRCTEAYTGPDLPYAQRTRYNNSCPLDNILTIIFLSQSEYPYLREYCRRSSSHFWQVHYGVYFYIKLSMEDGARRLWLREISCYLLDLHGSETTMIHGHIKHECSFGGDTGLSVQNVSCTCYSHVRSCGALRLSNMDLNEAANDTRCLFQRLLDNEIYGLQSFVSNSTLPTRPTGFEGDPSIFLTIDLSLVKRMLRTVDAIPDIANVGRLRYCLAGVTLHSPEGEGHFSAMVIHNSIRWRYDNSVQGLTPFNGQRPQEQLSFAVYRINDQSK